MKLFDIKAEEDTKYTKFAGKPQYEIKGDCPILAELFDNSKTNKFLQHIREANISQEEKDLKELEEYIMKMFLLLVIPAILIYHFI